MPAIARHATLRGRLLGAAGVIMIVSVLIGVGYVIVQRSNDRFAASAPSTQPTPVGTPTPTPSPSLSASPTPSASPMPSDLPTPTPTPTPAQPRLDERALPTTKDLRWRSNHTWQITDTTEGPGDDPASMCLPAQPQQLPGLQTVFRRDYLLPDTGYATALAMDFGRPADAEAAFRTVADGASGCRATLRADGMKRVAAVRAYDVAIPDGITGRVYRTAYRLPGQEQTYETVGLALAGDRLLMLSMVVLVADTRWAYGGSDSTLPPHPMFASLQAAAGRLTV